MNDSYSSFNSDQKPRPLNQPSAASLNDRIDTSYIDIAQDDNSMLASLTRQMVEAVGRYVTPRQMLGVLRVLKALTLCFLVLTMIADLMYLALLEIFAIEDVRALAGGSRDTFIRCYALFLSVLGIAIEFDITKIVKHFSGLRGFIPRGLLLYFISTLTRPHPIEQDQIDNGASQYQYVYGDDDANYNYNNGDDDANGYAYYNQNVTQTEEVEIPRSAVIFQSVTAFMLGVCAVIYLVFGLFCFDRFTSRAFLSNKDPLVTTAIPQPPGMQHAETRSEDSDVV